MGNIGSAQFTYQQLQEAAGRNASVQATVQPLQQTYGRFRRCKERCLCVPLRVKQAGTFVKVIPLLTEQNSVLALRIEVGKLVRTDVFSLADPVHTLPFTLTHMCSSLPFPPHTHHTRLHRIHTARCKCGCACVHIVSYCVLYVVV